MITMPVTRDNLDVVMDFDHVIEVHADGTVTEPRDVFAPDVYVTGTGTAAEIWGLDTHDGTWQLMGGYSQQHGYSGPIMHPSEYIGGGLAVDILAEPGYYVAVVVRDSDADTDNGDDDAAGWAVARREVSQ